MNLGTASFVLAIERFIFSARWRWLKHFWLAHMLVKGGRERAYRAIVNRFFWRPDCASSGEGPKTLRRPNSDQNPRICPLFKRSRVTGGRRGHKHIRKE